MSSPSRLRRPDRGWHRGRFPLVSPPPLDPSSVRVPSHVWGVWKWRLKGAADHLQADVFIVPAGLLVVGRCTECGGRVLRLVEFEGWIRPRFAPGPPDGPARETAPESTGRSPFGTALQQVFGVLDEGHRRCSSSPAGHRVAPLTKQFFRKALGDASRDIDSDDRTAGKLYLLMEDGRGCAVGTEHLIRGAPAPSAERTANRAAGVEAVRRYLRALDLSPAAAVLIAETWVSLLDGYGTRGLERGNCDEAVVTSLVTRTFGKVASGRTGWNSIAEHAAPALACTLTWQPIREPAPLVDGVLATSVSMNASAQ